MTLGHKISKNNTQVVQKTAQSARHQVVQGGANHLTELQQLKCQGPLRRVVERYEGQHCLKRQGRGVETLFLFTLSMITMITKEN